MYTLTAIFSDGGKDWSCLIGRYFTLKAAKEAEKRIEEKYADCWVTVKATTIEYAIK